MLTFLDIATNPIEELTSSDTGIFAIIGLIILVIIAVVVIVMVVRGKNKKAPAAGQTTGAASGNKPEDTGNK